MGTAGRLSSRILLAVGAGALLVAAGVALLLANTVSLRDGARAALRAGAYEGAVVDVERLVVDAETGLRGYVITGRDVFLQPLDATRNALPAATRALVREAQTNGTFTAGARRLARAADAYLSAYADRLIARYRSDPRAARSYASTLDGKRRVDAIRDQAAQLERSLTASEADRQRSAQHLADRAIGEAIGALVALTILTLLIGGYVGRIAVVRERERANAAAVSETLQQSIAPAEPPAVPGCAVAVRFRPVGGGIVGGDFYDVFEVTPDGTVGVALGDVSGKGASAAAVSAMARWTLRALATRGGGPTVTLRELNGAMRRDRDHDRFLTLAYLELTRDEEQLRVAAAAAGHARPILVRADGSVSPIAVEGDILGVWPTLRLIEADVVLGPGDSIVAFTDGVNDFGPEAARDPEEALAALPPDADVDALADTVIAIASGPAEARDDAAVIVVKFLGAPTPQPTTAPVDVLRH